MKIRKISSIIFLALIAVLTVIVIRADERKSWSLTHNTADMYFYGEVTFSERSFWFKSVITYYGSISGSDRKLSTLSKDSYYNLYRNDGDEVGTLLISTKNYHSGNCVKTYVASNHIVNTSQYKDYLSKINVDLQFGTKYSYVSKSFTLDDK